ncbi:MAG: iron ABC transporter [Planctomycetaceae bacterium]|nr:iron ABC transporter [Planctomycetaceae bacterium]
MIGVLAEVGWSWQLDGWIVLVAILCAVASASLGCFLVLRRMSMLGDAISHAVLPGLAVAFFLSHSRSSLPMFIGAVIVGILTAFFTEWIHRVGRVDKGASMGVVFTSLFALGLVMIVQAADKVDLDAGCVLYGSIELTPLDTMSLFGFEIPRAVVTLGIVTVINLAFVLLFYKELKLSSFDPSLATTLGFNASLMHYLLMILVAVTAVASFESVGSVLVVAMFVVPPAAAYLLTDRLGMMLLISVSLAISSALLGHLGAIHVPSWFGFQSTTTSGMMAVAAGSIFLITMLCSPSQGVLVKLIRRQALSLQIIADDVVAVLFRRGEKEAGEPQSASVTEGELIEAIFCGRWSLRLVLRWLSRRDEIRREDSRIELTDKGRLRAQNLVRSHRLWERYLQDYAGFDPSRVHPQAEKLEHFTDPRLRQQLDSETDAPQVDPHGRPIPDEPNSDADIG